MPEINRFACNRCEFALPTGWGSYVYATDACGNRVICPHPGEAFTVRRITGLGFGEANAAGRVGVNDECVCIACLKQFDLDLTRDERRCPECSSPHVKSTREMIDQPCPACKQGSIERGSPIRWQLDEDRAALPVPAIVKDIVAYVESRTLPASLQPAMAALQAVEGIACGASEMFTICIRLLGWWQGEYISQDSEPKAALGPFNPKWKGVRGLKAVVRDTPELDRLIRCHDECWCFRGEVAADVKRGMKNYAREYYKPMFMS